MVLADIFHRFSGIGEREYPLSTERYSEYARRLRGGANVPVRDVAPPFENEISGCT